jgi:enamine deaminase RidA (YjgF/YER057c/UK114 family)
VFADLGRVLAAGGARPDQATKITIFVAAMGRDQLPAIEAGRVALFGDHKPAERHAERADAHPASRD